MLPCFVETPLPLEELEVEWKRIDSETLVHLWQNGESRPESQDQLYHERAHFFPEEVAHGNYSLLLTDVTSKDAGVYKCAVYTKLYSGETLIEIKEIERLIVSGSHVISAYAGEDITLNCSVDSHLPPENIEEVSWKKMEEDILVLLYQEGQILTESTDERYVDRVEFFSTEERNKGNFSLRLKNVRTEDKGLYMCLVFSGALSANTTVEIQQLDESRRALAIQCAHVLCPNITMSIVFILWGVTDAILVDILYNLTTEAKVALIIMLLLLLIPILGVNAVARINREGCVRKGIRRKTLPNLTMRIVSTNFIPDRSRPGLTTTAIGAVDLQGAGGNWATVGRRSRGGRRVRRQREKRKGKSVGLRIGTLNVGTMTGKGRELADMMERRKVDILCVQETRWKGSKARSIGAGFKLFYYGVDSKRNGVGVVLKEEFVRNVLEVKRVSDRVMSLKLEIEGVMLNVVSGYAPQVGCELEEKERFWSELDEVMESIPTGERVVIGADFNGHVGEGNTGDEEVMGKFGVKERNLEGQMVVDFAKRMDMGVVNTYFQKREEHRVTYKSGGRRTQVDYILCRRGNLKEISDCKVVVGESVARQHRMVVCRMTLMVCKTKRSKIEKKTKWWKLKKEECCEEFRQKLRQALGGQVVLPDDWETTAEVIRETGRKVLGVSSGRRKEDKETWWWNEEVQDSIQRKRLAKKKWDMDRTEENRQEYKELQRRVKREVSKAKQKAYDELYTRLDTREGEKDLYRVARQRDRDGKDVQQVRVIKDRDGRVLTSEQSVQRRWKEYFEELMNEENEREKRVEGVNSVEQKVDKIRKDEVRKALKRMKSGKAVGPDDIPVEVWKCLGEAAVEFLANLFNRVLESERMPEEWRRSVLVPIFKNKGDVQSCSNYRGIKLMSHTMKLWERVVEARLRKVVDICEQQYGFMPRKSTTDAIFALRILMEKYRDGQKELHCVFVDLEKAYDRVPREELWYCMRKSGVAEKYVRVVQDMYERSRTVVRCAVGQTEEFKVKVGLHQGSALSPFLFAIVMDQLSEEVRQESPWTMMFADDIVICSESREQVEENLERWRFALERRGMKVSRSKTEYMCVNEREGSGTVRLQGEEVKKVQEFKYLGSTVQSNGECGKEVKKRVQAGWNGWRKVSGVLCDQKISARIKGKVYRTVVRPAMLYGLETVSLRKRQESELESV
ncbi:hypothetical protein QTP86_003652 [Hemibagrus guttatus]|nr:hypothetical protein QTP86_003652 [Hemibagrus guttatus]